MIDRATIEQVMEATNIAEVVSDFVALKRRGANFVACCPFHNEKTPSFYVSVTKGIYKCFGCGKSGNAVTFLRDHEQMSYVEAIKYLGKKCGIEVIDKEETPQEREQMQKRESLLIITEYAQKYFSEALLNTNEGKSVGLSYFQEREITEESIRDFGLGYADASRDSFTKTALAKGYKKELLLETGLVKVKQNAETERLSNILQPDSSQENSTQTEQSKNFAPLDSLYDGYRERVIFPIRDISGRVVAFGGRKLRSDNNLAKYINSPESQIYIKNKTLYGLFEAKKEIEKNNCCYLVEGYTDVISMAQKGIKNIVASCGTSLTQGQIQLIKRFTHNIVVLYDGDSAGIHASLRGIDMFLAEEFNVKVVLLPEGEDPDSFAKSHSAEELKTFLESAAEDFIAFKCRLSNNEELQKDPVKKAEFIKDISRSISVIPDAVLRNLFTSQVSQTLNIPLNALGDQIALLRREVLNEQAKEKRAGGYTNRAVKEYREPYNNPQKLSAEEFITNDITLSHLYKYERDIIYYLLKYGKETPGAGEFENENITVSQFIKMHMDSDGLEMENPYFKKIYHEFFTLDEEKSKNAIKYFSLKTGEEQPLSKLVIEVFDEKYNIRSQRVKGSLVDEKYMLYKTVPQLIYTYKAQICEERIGELIKKISNETLQTSEIEEIGTEESHEQEKKIMEQIKELSNVKKELLRLAKKQA